MAIPLSFETTSLIQRLKICIAILLFSDHHQSTILAIIGGIYQSGSNLYQTNPGSIIKNKAILTLQTVTIL